MPFMHIPLCIPNQYGRQEAEFKQALLPKSRNKTSDSSKTKKDVFFYD
jgi:hypothetical protein